MCPIRDTHVGIGQPSCLSDEQPTLLHATVQLLPHYCEVLQERSLVEAHTQALRLSGSQDLRLPGSQAFRLSGSQVFRFSGFQAQAQQWPAPTLTSLFLTPGPPLHRTSPECTSLHEGPAPAVQRASTLRPESNRASPVTALCETCACHWTCNTTNFTLRPLCRTPRMEIDARDLFSRARCPSPPSPRHSRP